MATSISSVPAKEPAPARVDTQPKPEANPAPPKPAAAEAPRENKAAAVKSEQSQASERVGNQLNAQLDQARANPPQAATQYVAEADIDGNGAVSDTEDAAYQNLLASAEAKASTYKSIANDDADKAATVSVKA